MFRALTNQELVEQYINEVLDGTRTVGKLERDAVQRHLDDLKTGHERGLVFSPEHADRACSFFPNIVHTTGEYDGQPFELKPFQRFIVWCLFGWLKVSTGMRRFTRAWIELARGNGKSPFAAALLLLCFAYDCPVEARAEAYTAATKRKQALIVLKEIKRFVKRNQAMQSRIRVMANKLVIPENDSELEALGQDSENQDGLIPHCITVDEIHAWQERHRELWDKIETGLGKRRQPLMIIITTYGDDDSEIWEEQHDFAVSIVDRETPINVDDWFVFIAAIDEEDDWWDESCWAKANPMLPEGIVKIDHLRNMAKAAQIDPRRLMKFQRYHLNRKTTAGVRLFPAKLWKLGAGELPELEGRECHAGFDWGWKDDLAALGLVFPLDSVEVEAIDEEGHDFSQYRRRYAARVWAWIPEGCERNLAEPPWSLWIEAGWLQVTAGNTTDTAAIYGKIGKLSEQYAIRTMAMDPNNCRELGSRVEPEFGIESFWFGQTHGKYHEPTKELADALNQGRFCHGDNPLLAWCAGNVVGSQDSRDYIKPEKKRSKDKIDPMCAVIMGLSECMYAEQEAASVFSSDASDWDD